MLATQAPEADSGKLMQKLLVSDSMIPLIMKGEPKKKVLLSLAKKISADYANMDLTDTPGP